MAVASSLLVLRWSRLVVTLVLGLGLGFGLGLAAAAGGFIVSVISGLAGVALLVVLGRLGYRHHQDYLKALKAKQEQHSASIQRLQSAVEQVATLEFYVCFVRFDDLKAHGELLSHEVVRGKNQLTVLDTFADVKAFIDANQVAFISHQVAFSPTPAPPSPSPFHSRPHPYNPRPHPPLPPHPTPLPPPSGLMLGPSLYLSFYLAPSDALLPRSGWPVTALTLRAYTSRGSSTP